MKPAPGDKIVVWFSCGAASAVAARYTIRLYGDKCDVRIVNNYVEEEDEDNRRFLRDVEQWLGVEIEQASNPKYPEGSADKVWRDRQFMSGPQGAPCTVELKKVARQHWEDENEHDWHVLGFTAEEEARHKRFVMGERDNVLPVLIEQGITKAMCYQIIDEAGIPLPRVYHMGYPNANCIGCVKATSPTYWNHVRRVHPKVFEARAKLSREIGARLVRVHPRLLPWCYQDEDGFWWDRSTGECYTERTDKGNLKTTSPRVFLDELPVKAKGRPMKGLDFECGIFCEEMK